MQVRDIPSFFVPEAIVGAGTILTDDEARHAKVLRLKTGDEVNVLNGKGSAFLGHISNINKKTTEVTVTEALYYDQRPRQQIELFLAPTKNMARMEWLLEKGTEMGLSSIKFIQTARSERQKINLDRLGKIAVSALKQSQNLWLPDIAPPIEFEAAISSSQGSARFIAHCMDGVDKKKLTGILTDEKTCFSFMVGPEGDFTPGEIEEANKLGWQAITLGRNRLRTETAAFLCIAGIYLRQ